MPGAKAVRHSISTNRRIESLTVTFDIMSHPFDDSCEEGTLATFISVMSASTAFPHCCSLHFATCYPCCLKTFIYQGACMLHKCTAPLALPFHEVLYDLSRRILLPSKTTPVIISAWLDDSMCWGALHTLGLREGWPVYVCNTEDQQPPSRTNHGIERVQGISAFSHLDSLVLWELVASSSLQKTIWQTNSLRPLRQRQKACCRKPPGSTAQQLRGVNSLTPQGFKKKRTKTITKHFKTVQVWPGTSCMYPWHWQNMSHAPWEIQNLNNDISSLLWNDSEEVSTARLIVQHYQGLISSNYDPARRTQYTHNQRE